MAALFTANIFGLISLMTSMRKVTIKTFRIIPISLLIPTCSQSRVVKIAAIDAAVTFTDVLPMRMVIKSRRGVERSFTTRCARFDFSSINFSRIILLMEKKAVSEPEKKAERNNKKEKTTINVKEDSPNKHIPFPK